MGVAAGIAAAACVIAIAAIAWCYALGRRLREISSARGEYAKMAVAGDVPRLAAQIEARLAALEEADERLRRDDAALAERLAGAVRHVGVVRFDALPGTAGRMSFSLALLDDRANGVVITSIYGRAEYRVYAKAVVGGTSEHALAEEEAAAISSGMSGQAAFAERTQRHG